MNLVAELCLEKLLAVVDQTLQSRAEESGTEADRVEVFLFLGQASPTIKLVDVHDLPAVLVHIGDEHLRDLRQFIRKLAA